MPHPDPVSAESARRLVNGHWPVGPVQSIDLIPGGRVNRTYRIGAPAGFFALQRLHPVFGTDGRVVVNWVRAARSLAQAGLSAPQVVPAADGRLWVEQDGLWRLTTWLPGVQISDRTPRAAAEAAGLLGAFHRALAAHPPDIQPLPPAPFNRDEPPGLAQWDEVLDRFGNRPDPPGAVRALERGRNLVHALPPFEPVTRAVLHGDPKLENALFDERGQALAWIDLDTLRHGFLIHELADGIRSWAGLRAPDDRVHLSRDCFLAAREAYRGRGLALTAKEWRVLPCALAAQALGLALRYLEDAFEPAYFAWDQARYPSPAEQNRRRGEGLLTLAAEALQLQSPDPSDPFTIDKGSPL